MQQAADGLDLAREEIDHRWRLKPGVHDLEGNLPLGVGLLCGIDRTHPALPQHLNDAIAADLLGQGIRVWETLKCAGEDAAVQSPGACSIGMEHPHDLLSDVRQLGGS